jgi:hypothetical protein
VAAAAEIVIRTESAESTHTCKALELMDAHRYSVIFLDATLPNRDAYELCGRIKQHPSQREAVVVMLTGGYLGGGTGHGTARGVRQLPGEAHPACDVQRVGHRDYAPCYRCLILDLL